MKGIIRYSLDDEVVKIRKIVEEQVKRTVIRSKIYYGFDTLIGVDILNDVWVEVDFNIGFIIDDSLKKRLKKHATTNNK